MTQRGSTIDRLRFSHGTENDPNQSLAEGKTPEIQLTGGVYTAAAPTYTDGDNAVSHYTSDGKLKVDAVFEAGDIEIGAVEIKNGASDQRATVDTTGALKVFDSVANSLVPAVYDYIALTYTGDNLTGVVYKTGGVGGTVVSTLTLAYSGSNLISVTRS